MDSAELRQAGLKVTAPRVKILGILEAVNERHMSAEEIFKTLSQSDAEVSLATVYRVLTQFEEAGLVIRHNFANNHCVFELNHGQHHDHLVCVRCGLVDEFMDPVIEKRQHEVAAKAGFTLTDHRHHLYGLCRTCQ